MPDLDVVFISGRGAKTAAQEVAEFYNGHGWKTNIYGGDVSVIDPEPLTRDGLRKGLPPLALDAPKMHDPKKLLKLARRRVGYSPNKFCWKGEQNAD